MPTTTTVASPNQSIQDGRVNAIIDPPCFGAAVTPNDSTDLANQARCLYIGGVGDVKVDTAGGSTLTFSGYPAGILPVQVRRVYSTGTTATNILALW